MQNNQPRLVLEDSSQIERFLSSVANWLNTHWIFKTFIQFLPSICSPIILTGLGTVLGLKSDSGLTTLGWIVVLIIYIQALLVSIVSNHKAKHDQQQNTIWASKVDEYDSAITLLNTIFDAEHGYERSIVKHTLTASHDVKWKMDDASKLQQLFSVEYSMQEINRQLKDCFEKITSLHKRDISISSLFSLDGKQWEWIDRDDAYGGLSLDELVQSGTTFYEVSSGNISFAYANDKASAAERTGKYKYKYDDKDLEGKAKGSIICWKVTLGDKNKEIAHAIINIATYNKKIADGIENPADIDTLYEDTIRNYILKHFEGEIQLALTTYYLSTAAKKALVS